MNPTLTWSRKFACWRANDCHDCGCRATSSSKVPTGGLSLPDRLHSFRRWPRTTKGTHHSARPSGRRIGRGLLLGRGQFHGSHGIRRVDPQPSVNNPDPSRPLHGGMNMGSGRNTLKKLMYEFYGSDCSISGKSAQAA
jgi:hypothetical protein